MDHGRRDLRHSIDGPIRRRPLPPGWWILPGAAFGVLVFWLLIRIAQCLV